MSFLAALAASSQWDVSQASQVAPASGPVGGRWRGAVSTRGNVMLMGGVGVTATSESGSMGVVITDFVAFFFFKLPLLVVKEMEVKVTG